MGERNYKKIGSTHHASFLFRLFSEQVLDLVRLGWDGGLGEMEENKKSASGV